MKAAEQFFCVALFCSYNLAKRKLVFSLITILEALGSERVYDASGGKLKKTLYWLEDLFSFTVILTRSNRIKGGW